MPAHDSPTLIAAATEVARRCNVPFQVALAAVEHSTTIVDQRELLEVTKLIDAAEGKVRDELE